MEDEPARSSQREPAGGGKATRGREPVDLQGVLLEVSRLAASRRDVDGLLAALVVVPQKAVPFDGLSVVLHDATRREMVARFAAVDSAAARIVLIHSGPAILDSFPEALREQTARELRDMGVEVHCNTRVIGVDERGVETSSSDPELRRIEAATKFWAAGVEASPLGRLVAEASGCDIDRAGRVKVEPDCTLPGHPEVFVIGDLMSLDGLPGLAQVAIQSGRHAAETISRRLAGDSTRRAFRYRDLGTMATISRFRAIAVLGRLHASGFLVWIAWLVVHLVALTGFKYRIGVLFNWAVAFLSDERPQRVITKQQVFARQALQIRNVASRTNE